MVFIACRFRRTRALCGLAPERQDGWLNLLLRKIQLTESESGRILLEDP